ncbi:hypothetical protein U3B29_17615 [Proteus mirabilis]|nr:hypothetical protein [Proteus mirabilis]
MIQVGQYYFGDSGVKWVSFQLVLTPAYPRCYIRAPIVGAWPGLPEAVRNVDAEVRRGGRPMNADLSSYSRYSLWRGSGLPLGDNPSCSGLITSGRYT